MILDRPPEMLHARTVFVGYETAENSKPPRPAAVPVTSSRVCSSHSSHQPTSADRSSNTFQTEACDPPFTFCCKPSSSL